MEKAAVVFLYIVVGIGFLALIALDELVSFGIRAAVWSLFFG